jgi:hypothetical protein
LVHNFCRLADDNRKRIRKEEEAERLKVLRRRLHEDQRREKIECAAMLANDIRYFTSKKAAIIPLYPDIADGMSVAKEADDTQESEFHSDGDADDTEIEIDSSPGIPRHLTAFQKRVQMLKDNIHNGISDVTIHSRRDHSGAFFPLMFSEDISWNPFASTAFNDSDLTFRISEQDQDGDQDDDADDASVSDFSDLSRLLKRRKKQLERDRLHQLYRNMNIPAKDWTTLVTTSRVDWEAFFKSEGDARLSADELSATDNSLSDENKWLADRLNNLRRRQSTFTSVAGTGSFDADVEIRPLPFGHILKGVVEIGSPALFQVSLNHTYLYL